MSDPQPPPSRLTALRADFFKELASAERAPEPGARPAERPALRWSKRFALAAAVLSAASVGWLLQWRPLANSAEEKAKSGIEQVLGGHFHGRDYHGIPSTECKCGLRAFNTENSDY